MKPSGILNIDKSVGWTSFQVVALVRKGSGVRKVGHAGTLDPAASGVLLVCLNQAVRISQYLMELPKLYRARIVLGVTTDTYDAEGQTLATGDFTSVTEGHLRAALQHFVGPIQQIPPSFSAIKVGGQPAYRLARKGQQLALKPRPVRIDHIELLRFEPPLIELEVKCGKGTYIRSLAHDLGQHLGCGAHLNGLIRTLVGPFTLDSALALPEIEEALETGAWRNLLLPLDYGLADLPAITLEHENEMSIRHGCPLLADAVPTPQAEPFAPLRCRAYSKDGSLLAIVVYDDKAHQWRPEKVFAPV